MKIPRFDSAFVREWEQQYYRCEESHADEREYHELIKATQEDIARTGTISKDMLRRILKWKDRRERVERKVIWERYEIIYEPRFRLIIGESVPDHHKMLVLIWSETELRDKLPVGAGLLDSVRGKAHGFGIPVASTVLHFIYPDTFPIIDIRTAEALYLFDQLGSTDRSKHSVYTQFCSKLLETATKTGHSLHTIDRALFAFHEQLLQLAMYEECKQWGFELGYSGQGIGKGLPLDAPRKFRQMIISRIKEAARNKTQFDSPSEFTPSERIIPM